MSKIDAAKVKRDAHGKWPSILESLGVERAFLTNKHGPCPICQDGKDRFRFDDKGDGRWFCSHCQNRSGDGFSLLMGVRSWSFPEALEEVAKVVGTARPIMVRSGPDPEVIRAEMKRIWDGGLSLEMVEEAADYWRRRVGCVPTLNTVRATPALRCPGENVFPAMLAIVQGLDGKAVNLHRTFLTIGGDKAPIDEPRRVMPLTLPKGSAVRLAPVADQLGIAEGVETAVAATLLTGIPCWAALNATLLEGWEPPEVVRRVVIFGDNDRNFAGQAAAYNLGKRLRSKKLEAEVRIPPAPGMDWNDVWNARSHEAAA